jgi:hypothetical protein
MAKRNITLQLDEEVIAAVKLIAARRGTSVSALLAQQLRELVEEAAQYEYAKERALKSLEEASGHGGYRFNREELYDRWDRRYA